MSGANTNKEHLQYNEKSRNVKNIVFDPRQLFDPCKSFMDLRHPRYPRQHFDPNQNIMDPHTTHAKISTHAILFDSYQNFMDPRHPPHTRTHAM